MSAKPTPIHPPTGLAQHEAEARRRIVETILANAAPIRSKDDLLEIAEWVYYGSEDES